MHVQYLINCWLIDWLIDDDDDDDDGYAAAAADDDEFHGRPIWFYGNRRWDDWGSFQ